MVTLADKTREQLEELLKHKSRAELIDLVHSLVTVDRLLKPREVAQRLGIGVGEVRKAMREGKFVDPLFGAGYFSRATNSTSVSANAVNRFKRRFFVPVRSSAVGGNGDARR